MDSGQQTVASRQGMSVLRLVISVLRILLLTYAGFCLVLFLAQRSLLYHPVPAPAIALPNGITLEVEGASLRVLVRERAGADALLYFGGNAEDVSYALADFERAFPDHALYFPNYRGYGGSSGEPTEAALHADARRVYELARARHARVMVVGRSLGTGVAVRLAAEQEVSGLVLVTPYDSLVQVGKHHFSWLPVGLLLRDRFESWRHAPRVKAPTLILQAENDMVIPAASTEALHAAFAPGVARLALVKGASHNSIAGDAQYFRLMSTLR